MSGECREGVERPWFSVVKALDESRDAWIKRSIVTLDLSDQTDVGTFVERVTYDIDWQAVLEKSDALGSPSEKDIFIPVAWRPRVAFLEFDCKSNLDRSLTLVPLRDRIDYVEWLFWNECCSRGVCSELEISDAVRRRLRLRILGKSESEISICSPLDPSEQRIWDLIERDPRLERTYRLILEFQPVILLSTNDDDLSILKIAERKSMMKPKVRKAVDAFKGTSQGVIECRASSCTKIMAPGDVRIKSAYAFSIDGLQNRIASRAAASIYGDGSWAFSNERRSESNVAWLLEFTTRRSYFLEPGLRILSISLLAVLYWWVTGHNSDEQYIRGLSLSFTIVGSFYLHGLILFNQYHARSLPFKWVLGKQQLGLATAMVLTLLFPYIGHVSQRVSSLIEPSLDWPGIGDFSQWLVDLLRSVKFYGCLRVVFASIILLVFVSFLRAWYYGRPAVKTRS